VGGDRFARLAQAERMRRIAQPARIAERRQQVVGVVEAGPRGIRLGEIDERRALAPAVGHGPGETIGGAVGRRTSREHGYGTMSIRSITSPSRMPSTTPMPFSTWANTVYS